MPGVRRDCHYVASRDGQVAYLTGGQGPPLVWLGGTLSGEAFWDEPLTGQFLDRIAGFASVIVFEPRGSGSSDPLPPGEAPTTQDMVDDLCATLDGAGVDIAWVFGFHAGVALAVALAASHPERVQGLFLVNGWVRLIEADDHPWGITASASDALIEAHARALGTGMFADVFSPSRTGDPLVRETMARIERAGTSRAQAMLLTRWAQEVDVRDRLGAIMAPTVVMHNTANTSISVEHGRYLAAHIAGARLVEFEGTDQAFTLENPEPVLLELEAFVTGVRPRRPVSRRLVTLLFTDVVDSTRQAAEIGDHRWRDLLDAHDAAVRHALDRHDGVEVKNAGDGFLATFDLASDAIAAAVAIERAVGGLGLRVRSGIHVGEVDVRGDDVGGLAVHIASRVSALAGPGEVLVSAAVVDVVAGSVLTFTDRGRHQLKGVPGTWALFKVDRG